MGKENRRTRDKLQIYSEIQLEGYSRIVFLRSFRGRYYNHILHSTLKRSENYYITDCHGGPSEDVYVTKKIFKKISRTGKEGLFL